MQIKLKVSEAVEFFNSIQEAPSKLFASSIMKCNTYESRKGSTILPQKALSFYEQFQKKWEKETPSAVKCLEQSIESCLTYFEFPQEEVDIVKDYKHYREAEQGV